MAVYTVVSAEALAAFLQGFDIGEVVALKGIAEGVENSNYLLITTRAKYILTLYEKRVAAADLPFFFRVIERLAERGLPVPRAVPDRAGRTIHELEGRPACLIEFLPGVSVTRPTARQARATGAALGRMHRSLERFDGTRPNAMGVDSWLPLFERCGRALEEIAPGLYDDLGFALDDTLGGWNGHLLDQSVIHADLFPDNVLMRGDEVTGLIDFYFACTDARAYDVAVAHTAWCFDSAGRRYDKAVSDALIAGYEEHFPLEPAERGGAFATLAVGACLRFTLSRAWDWLNTPVDALVTRKDPLAYWRRVAHYDSTLPGVSRWPN